MQSMRSIPSLLLITLSVSFIGCSTASKQSGIPALFNTKVEAEKAAKDFNCTGAHKMGEKWMPCEKHEDHGNHQKHGAYGNHHNH